MPRIRPKVSRAAFDALPLFASDRDIAVALVGEDMAPTIIDMMPVLERMGFPKPDPFFVGRYVPAVRQFLDHRYGLTATTATACDGGVESERWDLLDNKTGRLASSGTRKAAAPSQVGFSGNKLEQTASRRQR
ncbi:hypothetical protein SAMN02799631_00398 [Methylobacterium sp. 174MFSha1.1]|uniref:hypothetical protein n=1 Tax=Methylobacterium sp. 174MFSha1.1 TaxID=1502749 RepID=UPI0008E0951B|nr:hypothetical protein [Methylobacterium sp. 174MFSha1.1]SFU39031.1 hypothetical protein SAMN02799631_00398 [Methylobacterium sp. 174MFSha1.1]